MKAKYVVSACLTGELCRYDGNSNYNERVASLVHDGFGLVICPEVMGGLPTPRIPSEIKGDKVFSKVGKDVTIEFNTGAIKALEICKKYNIKKAILKEESPSCGTHKVHDGTFSNHIVDGLGVTAKLFKENGIKLYSEKDEAIYDAIICCAGSSTRTKLSYNKLFHYNKNECVAEKTINNFLGDFLCNKVFVVCKKEEQKFFEAIFTSNKIVYVNGGDSREESVYNALKLVEKEKVLIHDGARPYVSEELIDNVLDNLENNDAVVPFTNIANEYDYQVDGLFVQTPQGFNAKKLLSIFDEIKDNLKDYRDESSIFSLKGEVKFIQGDRNNTKITVYQDLQKFEKGE